MFAGNTTLVGNGGVRTVFLVEYGGKKLAVKPLNDMKRLAQHHREVVTLNAVRALFKKSQGSGVPWFWHLLGAVTRGITRSSSHIVDIHTAVASMSPKQEPSLLP